MQRDLQERTERIDLRVPEYVKARIKAAAGLTGRNVSDFVISAALREADEVDADVERWQLDRDQSRWLIALLADTSELPNLRALLELSEPQAELIANAARHAVA
jgi:uncharacterized protein (DUF1778 family)